LHEAEALKSYLDSKNNFSNNVICKITEDDEADIIGLAITAKKIDNNEISLDEPIEISQCDELSDYSLDFEVIGYLNTNLLR
jgi:hypothetical protein